MRKLFGWIVLCGLCCLAVEAFAAPQKGGLVATDRTQVDDDYAVQGEYEGTYKETEGEAGKVGAQVIALGDGKFDLVFYVGGLPGKAWKRGDRTEEAFAARDDSGAIVVFPSNDSDEKVGAIADGVISITAEDVQATLKRVERKSPTLGAEPPKSATVIVGKDVNRTDGAMNEDAEGQLWSGATTKDAFAKPFKMHLEFLLPYMPQARGQGRSNSGVYLHDCYEVQVLDSFGLDGLDNECGGIYKVKAPDVNMCLPPLQWQTYDIDFTPPTFDDSGKRTAQAQLTLRHNGVVIHDALKLEKTPGRQGEGPGPRPIHLQQHGNKVQYRNVWVIEE